MSERAVILLAEDTEDDILLVRRAFKSGYINNPLFVVRDGEEAVDYLRGVGKFGNRAEYPLPDLLLLDLKMPKVDGFEVLKWIRAQPGLNALRVVVLTSSDDMKDVNRAYRLGANSFMVKPMDFQDVVHMSQFLSSYWLVLSKAPEVRREGKSRSESVS